MPCVDQKGTFQEGSEEIAEHIGIEISAKQIENVSHYWGEEAGDLTKLAEIEQTKGVSGLHYVMVHLPRQKIKMII